MFWERFHSLCKENNISANQVVTALGISHGAPTKWRQLGIITNGDTLLKLSEYFDVSTDYLLGKTDIRKGAAPNGQPLTPLQEKALNMILSLPDSALEDLMRFLDALQKKDD